MPSPVEQIKEKIDIVELIASYIKLDKAGANFKALCPFHSEKTPSFYVTPARQIWHCFGCNAGGDVLRFVMNIENIEFPEALRILADKAGIELRREDPKLRSERTRILDLLNDATRFYEKNLFERKDVGAYLKERGLTGETAKSFRLGFAKNSWDGIVSYLRSREYKFEEIEKAGLAIKSEKDASFYDRFRARIMFPLFDASGRIVGFSGRIFERDVESREPEALAKYINTPQTLLYDKSRILYGFDRAKSEIRKQNTCVILEGQMDLIMSHQAGIAYAVAVSGTALTRFHLNILKRLSDTLILSFDMDAAGFDATTKSIDEALKTGFDIKVVNLESSKDPADIIKEDSELWKKALAETKPIIPFLLEQLSQKNQDPRSLIKEVGRMVLPYVAKVSSELDRAYWVGKVANFLKIREEAVWQELEKMKIPKASLPDQSASLRIVKSRRDLLEERLIGLVCWKRDMFKEELIQQIVEWFSAGRQSLFRAGFLNKGTQDHYVKKMALEAELIYAEHEDLAEEVKSLAKELQKEHIKEGLLRLSDAIRVSEEGGNDSELEKTLKEFQELSSQLNTL